LVKKFVLAVAGDRFAKKYLQPFDIIDLYMLSVSVSIVIQKRIDLCRQFFCGFSIIYFYFGFSHPRASAGAFLYPREFNFKYFHNL